MKTIKFLSVMTAIVFAVFLVGCAGKDGAPGATGPAGANGTNGTNGTANISSQVFTVNPTAWTDNGKGIYCVNETDDSIANATTDEVAVFTSTDQTSWYNLPAPGININGVNISQINYQYSAQNVQFYNDSTAVQAYPSNTLFFKVVVIPPAAMKQHPKTNWKDYSQVNGIIEAQNMFK